MAIQPIQFKADEITDEGRFRGLASVFGTIDQGGDIVQPGAFKRTLAEHAKNGTRVVMLRDHNPSDPVGIWESIKETPKGLEVVGKLTLGVAKAKETLALLKDQALTGLSIGYRVAMASRHPKTGARLLDDVHLAEISLVSMPMHPGARVVSVKADEIGDIREFETFLREAGWSRERAKVLAKGFRPASNGQRDVDRPGVGELARAIRERAAAISARG
jgi:hypothetical protein